MRHSTRRIGMVVMVLAGLTTIGCQSNGGYRAHTERTYTSEVGERNGTRFSGWQESTHSTERGSGYVGPRIPVHVDR